MTASGRLLEAFCRPRGLLAASLVLALATTTACSPARLVSGIKESMTTDEALARRVDETHQEIVGETPLYDNKALAAYVDKVGQRVAAKSGAPPGRRFQFFVLDSGESNAFAIPGGNVYVFRGLLLLLGSEEQLAAVLGHEVAHVNAGHAASQARARGGSNLLGATAQAGSVLLGFLTFNPLLMMGGAWGGDIAAGTLTGALSAGYGRQQELEADRLGLQYASAAGYRSIGAVESLQRVQGEGAWMSSIAAQEGRQPDLLHGVFASHPDNQARLAELRRLSAGETVAAQGNVGDYLASLSGVRYGYSDKLGTQRGKFFYDGLHQKVSTVPDGWRVRQTREHRIVIFGSPNATASIRFSSDETDLKLSALEMARDAIGEATLEGSMKSFAGRKVWRGTATVDRQRFEVVSWIEPIADGQRGYLVTGLNQSSDRARPAMSQGEWLKTFESFAQSVRAMRTDEKALASPPKLRIGTTTAASTYERLAATVPLGAERLAQLRVINGQYPDGQPGVRRFKFID